jgi:Ca2+-binding EF-hand superfamily protein
MAAKQKMAEAENLLKKFRDEHSKAFMKLTATQFLQVWRNYDKDGNGMIEGAELEHFILQLVQSTGLQDKDITKDVLSKVRKEFMEKYDLNKDDKIEIRELSHLLPMEENFLLLFRRDNMLDNSQEFMKIWRKYDQNGNGYIEKDELEDFITQLFKAHKKEIPKTTISEYADVIMKLFDVNGDGQLQISELTKLLPVKENLLEAKSLKLDHKITIKDLDEIFTTYDRDGSGAIDGLELEGFLKDLFALTHQTYHITDLATFKKSVMDACDTNKDGNLQRDELTVVMLQFSNMAFEKK